MNKAYKMLLSLLLALSSADGLAVGSANTEIAKETPLMRRAFPDVPGKEALIETVVIAPGEAAPAHRHNADVFAYVLEGSIITQVRCSANRGCAEGSMTIRGKVGQSSPLESPGYYGRD